MIKNKELLIKGRFAQERADILAALQNALLRVDSYSCVRRFIKTVDSFVKIGDEKFNLDNISNVYLIAFGKAAIRMTEAVLETIRIDEGVVVSNEPCANFPGNIRYFSGGHPIPNENSVLAGTDVLNLASKTKDNDLTLILVSGGGSALLEKPLVPLRDLQKVTALLMKVGADIFELNTVRKHLSEIKGGKLLSKLKGNVVSLIISDVIGDSLDTIASGPTYFDNSTFADAIQVLKKYDILDKVPKSVVDVLKEGSKGKIPETLKEDSYMLKKCHNFLVATNFDACKSAENLLRQKGYSVLYLGSGIQGESREVAKVFGGIISELSRGRLDIRKPVAIIFGGETTVTVKGNGVGGRNEEFVLAMLPFLEKSGGAICSLGTDGIDGLSDAAGAIADSNTLKDSQRFGLDWKEYLRENNSYMFFKKIGGLVFTGKTGTNVADIVIYLSTDK